MTVHENIRRIRIEKGLTQKQVAEACGTVDATIRAYELGKANPKPATVAKIARALGVSAAELYGMEESEQISSMFNSDIVSAIYQSQLLENGGVIDEDTMNKRHLLAAFDMLNSEGQKEAIRRTEEMASVPKFKRCRILADIMDKLTQDEQDEVTSLFHSLQEALLERTLMEKRARKNPEALRNNKQIIGERQGEISSILLTAFERFEDAKSEV